MKIIISNKIYLFDSSHINPILKRELTIPNPKLLEAKMSGRRTFGIKKTLSLFEDHDDGWVSIPRGCEYMLEKLLNSKNDNTQFTFNTNHPDIDVEDNIKLLDYQVKPTQIAFENYIGVLSLGTGGGKTVMGLKLIAKRKKKTFILVHTKDLLHQWRDRIKSFLNEDCGIVGAGKFQLKNITVGMVQTVNRLTPDNAHYNKEELESFGFLIVDECHRTPSTTFTDAVSKFSPYYILGLSATPYRRDKLTKFIEWTLGPVLYNMTEKELIDAGKIIEPTIIEYQTELIHGLNEHGDPIVDNYTQLLSQLKKSDERKNIIANAISDAAKNKNCCLLITGDHKEYLDDISSICSFKKNISFETLYGDSDDREGIVNRLNSGKINVLFSTMHLICEGFDYDGFTDLFLTMPISFEGRLRQIIGRVVRASKNKTTVNIHDFVDSDDVFQSQFKKRKKVYEGYK